MNFPVASYRSSVFSVALALIVTGVIFSSCSKQQSESQTSDSTKVSDTTAKVPAHYTVTPAEHTDYPNAKLVIVSPREGQVIKNAKDSIRVIMQVTGMELAQPTHGDSAKGVAYSHEGQHVHIIVDDKPYMADYRNGQPFNVGILAPGLHTIRAFPSFSWHESIKSPHAFATRSFFVAVDPKDPKIKTSTNLSGPLLTYSRPKGRYTTDEAKKVLLDFYVTNATLAPDGYHVKLWIDSVAQPDITDWQPYYIEGLTKGSHTIKLQLVDAQGKVVPGEYNSPVSEIVVE